MQRSGRRWASGMAVLAVAVTSMAVQVRTASAAAAPAYAWGSGAFGQMADGTHTNRPTPAPVAPGLDLVQVAVGGVHTLAIGRDGLLYAWGGNGFGEIGDGTLVEATAPKQVQLPNGAKPIGISAGNGHSVAIGDDGALYAWGWGGNGQLGLGYVVDRQAVPLAVPMPAGVHPRQVSAGIYETMVLGDDGHAYASGANFSYALGDGTKIQRTTLVKVQIPGDAALQAVSMGYGHATALGLDGTVYTWGSNNSGQLGTGSTAVWTDVRTAALPTGGKARAVSAANGFELAIGTDDRIYSWGSNTRGQLGDGSIVDRWAPVAVSLPNGVVPVALDGGVAYSAVLGDDGKLYTFGENGSGALGDGTTISRATPTPAALPTGAVVTSFSIGDQHVVALTGAAPVAPPPPLPPVDPPVTPPVPDPPVLPPARPPVTNPDPQPSSGFHTIAPVRIADTRDGGVPRPLEADVERVVPVAGLGGVPLGATRAAVRITLTDATGYGELYVHACGPFDPTDVVLLPVRRGATTAALALPDLVDGAFCVTATAGVHLIVDEEGYEAPGIDGMAYVDLPDRALLSGFSIAAGTAVHLPVAGVGGVPSGAGAVSIALTAVGDRPGYVTVYPCDVDRPLASTLNLDAQDPSETAAVGALAADGSLCVFSLQGATVDVTVFGYWGLGASATARGPVTFGFAPLDAPGYVAVTPRRLFDTRDGLASVAAGTVHVLDLAADLPDTASDVVMNVTVTKPAGAGFVTVYPCSAERPTVSNLNYIAGQTVPNLVTVSIGDDAKVCLYTSATAHLIADLGGWYEVGAGDGLVSVAPTRLLDTRDLGPRLPTGAVQELDLSGVVDADATAVVMNVTATEPAGAGFVTVYPCEAPRPTASNLNVVAGQTVPNLVTVAVGSDRRVCLYTSVAAHLLADLSGWYSSSSDVGYVGLVPERTFDTRDDGVPVPAGGTIGVHDGPGVRTPAVDPMVAVVLNVTAVDPTGPGFVTVFGCAAGQPTASNLNYIAGQVVANLVIVQLDDADAACFSTHQTTHLIADIAGYFTQLPLLLPVALT